MSAEETPMPMAGVRVLVVEDEVAIAMLIEDMLLDLGAEVIGPAGRLAQATSMADGHVDLAIIDVNVAGEPVYPLAEILAAKSIPFVFSTGYGAGGIEQAWRDRPVLQKPFSQADLEKVLRAVRVGETS